MNAKIIVLLLFPLWGCFAQKLNIRYSDTLVKYEKVLTQCIKEHNDHELDCRKEYYHALQDYESDVFYAVRKVKEKTKTAAEIEAMNVAEGEWKRSSYWYIAKLMKEFKDKHPGKFVWDTDADLKADIRIFYIKTAQYFTDRMNYLLSLIKDSQ
ncbi:hypothetical protein [uncultured Flavobacterium sp.]|uniref:hypothetical protein n=1 Tax=uncultured Flavobacterium sp. TaxID=165435 RepID=UPI003081482D